MGRLRFVALKRSADTELQCRLTGELRTRCALIAPHLKADVLGAASVYESPVSASSHPLQEANHGAAHGLAFDVLKGFKESESLGSRYESR